MTPRHSTNTACECVGWVCVRSCTIIVGIVGGWERLYPNWFIVLGAAANNVHTNGGTYVERIKTIFRTRVRAIDSPVQSGFGTPHASDEALFAFPFLSRFRCFGFVVHETCMVRLNVIQTTSNNLSYLQSILPIGGPHETALSATAAIVGPMTSIADDFEARRAAFFAARFRTFSRFSFSLASFFCSRRFCFLIRFLSRRSFFAASFFDCFSASLRLDDDSFLCLRRRR